MTRAARNTILGIIGMSTLLLVTLFVTVCTEVADGKIVLVVLKTLNNPYYIEMQRGVEQSRATLDESYVVESEAFDREDDVEGQITVIRTALERGGLSAVSIAPASSTDLVPIVKELNDRGVYVVVVDTRLDRVALASAGARVDAFIGSDNRRGGELAAKFLGEQLSSGAQLVLLLEGVPSQETAVSRREGFEEVAMSEYPSWLLRRRVANWNREEARAAVSSVINTEGVPTGIFASNDEMALGAVAALEAAEVGEEQWPVIVGFDATPDALKAISDGKMHKTIEQEPFEMGRAAVEIAVGLTRDKIPRGEERLIPVRLVP